MSKFFLENLQGFSYMEKCESLHLSKPAQPVQDYYR